MSADIQTEKNGLCLITGGTGFVGRHLAASLLSRGGRVRILTRSEAGRVAEPLPGAEYVHGDLGGDSSLGQALAGVEKAFHLASFVREAAPADEEFRRVNVLGTERLARAAAAAGVSRFVHVSTTGVHGNVEDPPADEDAPIRAADIYQKTKWEGEEALRLVSKETGLPITIIRPAGVYGPGDARLLKLFRLVQKGRFVMLGDGTTLFHPVHVSDLVRGILLAAESERAVGRTYIVAGERPVKLAELVERIAAALGVQAPRLRFPAGPVLVLAGVVERVCRPFGIEPPLFRRRVEFFTKNRAFSWKRAAEEIGYRPEVSLEDGLAGTVAWYREKGWL